MNAAQNRMAEGTFFVNTYWLNMHVGYACRHSGACCSARWPIPIERDRAGRVAQAIATNLVSPAADPWLHADLTSPEDVAGILALHCLLGETQGGGIPILRDWFAGSLFSGIFFAMFCIQSVQLYQIERNRHRPWYTSHLP